MKLRILAVAHRPRGWVAEAAADYLARLRPFADVSVELANPADEHAGGAAIAKRADGEALLKKIRADDFVIACDPAGKAVDSLAFAKTIGKLRDAGEHVTFVIGGSHGLSAEILKSAKLTLSFGAITLPHELFRVVLLEQLYRSAAILAGKTYHK